MYSARKSKTALRVQITAVLPKTRSCFAVKYRELARLGLGNKYPFVMHLKHNSVQTRLNQLNYVSGIGRGTRAKTALPLEWKDTDLDIHIRRLFPTIKEYYLAYATRETKYKITAVPSGVNTPQKLFEYKQKIKRSQLCVVATRMQNQVCPLRFLSTLGKKGFCFWSSSGSFLGKEKKRDQAGGKRKPNVS